MARRNRAAVRPRLTGRGVRLGRLASVRDARGRLIVAEAGAPLPFIPRRCFFVMDVPGKRVRGKHAQKKHEKFLVCLRGRVTVMVDDGRRRQEFLLKNPARGLHVPPMVWAEQYDFSPDAILAVFASARYDPRDYILTYDEFVRRVRRSKR